MQLQMSMTRLPVKILKDVLRQSERHHCHVRKSLAHHPPEIWRVLKHATVGASNFAGVGAAVGSLL